MDRRARARTIDGAARPRSRRPMPTFMLAASVVAAVCYGSTGVPRAAAAQSADPKPAAANGIRHVKSRLLVQARAGLSTAELDKILKPHGARRTHYLTPIDVHVIELPAQASEIAVANLLRANPHIEFAELDVALEPNLVLNDPYLGSAWHLPKIGAPKAWDLKTGTGVTVAILDTGVDATHADLQPQLVPGWNAYDNSTNTADVHGHGTKVAGIALAAGNNAAGSAGVAFGAKLMPIRVTDTSGYGYFSTMAAGISWAADHGAKVASISFQGAAGSATVNSAAQYMRSKGGVVVTAAGNTGALEPYASSDYITVVSATDSSNNVASFSSYGKFVDLAAPGVSIYTTSAGGGYGGVSGTSAATPVVAGVYALMVAANPMLAAASLDSIVFSTALDIGLAGKDDRAGWGVVDASAAVLKAAQAVASDSTPPTVAITSPASGTRVSGLVPINVNATDNTSVARVELYVNGALYGSDSSTPFAFSWDTTPLADGAVGILARAFDSAGNVGASTTINLTVANDTTPPVVSLNSPGDGAAVSGTVSVSASASDNKQVASMSLFIDGKEVAKSFGSSLSYSWDTAAGAKPKGGRQKTSAGTSRSLTVKAADAAGNEATKTVSVTVR